MNIELEATSPSQSVDDIRRRSVRLKSAIVAPEQPPQAHPDPGPRVNLAFLLGAHTTHSFSGEQRAGSREQRAGSREQRAESREQSAECRVQSAECRVQSAESREQRAECHRTGERIALRDG